MVKSWDSHTNLTWLESGNAEGCNAETAETFPEVSPEPMLVAAVAGRCNSEIRVLPYRCRGLSDA